MEYKQYIDLGFERVELNCGVEFKSTGYGGFVLVKNLTNIMMVEVSSGSLDKPKLYIKKNYIDQYHILNITCEIVKALINSQ